MTIPNSITALIAASFSVDSKIIFDFGLVADFNFSITRNTNYTLVF